MNKIKTSYHYLNIKKIINEDGILSQKIQTYTMEYYQQIIQSLRQYLNLQMLDQRQVSFLKLRISDTMKIIKEVNSQLSINFVVKKLLFLQFFIRWGCQNSHINDQAIELLNQEIKLIMKDDLNKLSKTKSKSFMSLEKIGTFFRQLSASKKESSKMKFEQLSQNQTVREIVSQILQPYCCYLLRLISDCDTYRSSLKKDQSIYTAQVMWKLINWNIILNKTIGNLHKIGRYFGEDFLGVWILCCYMISQDESVFYSILKENIQKESQKWLEKLLISKKYYQINKKSHSEKLISMFSNDQLQEIVNLKRQIDEINKIKEGLNYLYLNKSLKQWRSFFKSIPLKIVKLNKQQHSTSDELLNVISALSKYKEFSSIFSDFAPPPTGQKIKIMSSLCTQAKQQTPKQLNQTVPTAKQMTQENNIKMLNKLTIATKQQPRRNNIFTQKRNRILGRN